VNADAATVTTALQLAKTPVDLLLTTRELLPARSGFYAWWSQRGAIASVPHLPHPLDDRFGLLYVGISPSRASSRATVRSRVLQHLGGNIGSSTFRFILAALLLDDLRLQPGLRKGRYVLEDEGEADLCRWQKTTLHVSWCERERPWEVEHAVIATLKPPLNSAANANHPFYARVRDARADLRRRAKQA
jgi:hypothetical protein